MIHTDDLYIVNYCHPNCMPFMNICRLPKEEAFSLAYKMAEENPGVTAFGRFADFENYYPGRMKQEEYLYSKFVSLGGKPVEKHPLSFVLQGSVFLDHWFGNGIVNKIRLNKIPPELISFTLGDSMTQYKKAGTLTMYTKEMLLNIMNGYSGSIEEFMTETEDKYHYIEVQLWDDGYCKS